MSDFIKDYYTKLHSKKDHRINENGHKYKHTYELRKNIIKYMLNKINFNKSIDILDAGCGSGNIYKDVIMPRFKEINYSLGVDFIENAAYSSNDLFSDFKVGNVLELSKISTKKFDLVNSTEVFLYISESERSLFFNEHVNSLKNGGYFLLTVPNLESFYRKIFKPEKELFPYHFNHKDILLLSKRNDIELVATNGIDVFNNIYTLNHSLKFFVSFELCYLYKKIA